MRHFHQGCACVLLTLEPQTDDGTKRMSRQVSASHTHPKCLGLGLGYDTPSVIGEEVCHGSRPRNSTCMRQEIEGADILDMHISFWRHGFPETSEEHSVMPRDTIVGILHKYLRFLGKTDQDCSVICDVVQDDGYTRGCSFQDLLSSKMISTSASTRTR